MVEHWYYTTASGIWSNYVCHVGQSGLSLVFATYLGSLHQYRQHISMEGGAVSQLTSAQYVYCVVQCVCTHWHASCIHDVRACAHTHTPFSCEV